MNYHESKAQKNNGESGSVALAVNRDFKNGPKKGTALCVGSLDTLPRTTGGQRHHNGASVVKKVN